MHELSTTLKSHPQHKLLREPACLTSTRIPATMSRKLFSSSGCAVASSLAIDAGKVSAKASKWACCLLMHTSAVALSLSCNVNSVQPVAATEQYSTAAGKWA